MNIHHPPIEHSDRDFVGSFAKGLRVITVFNESTKKMTVSDVAKAANMTRAGARRLLLTLHALGYLGWDGKYFSLTPKILELGFSYLNSQNWISLASPILEELRNQLDEPVSITVLDGTEVVYVARFPVDRVMTMAMDIGSRKPAFCSAMGRVLLAELQESQAYEVLNSANIKKYTDHTIVDVESIMVEVRKVRAEGYSLVDRELETSLIAISVPLRNYLGETLGAINVCGHPSSLPKEDLETRCLPLLKESCHRLRQLLA